MYAITRRAFRGVDQTHRRPACRVIAGVRHPLARNFHRSAVVCRASESPTTGAAASGKKDDKEKPEGVKGHASSEDGFTNGAEKSARLNDALRRSGRRLGYGSAPRRAGRNRLTPELPQLILPEWFWERNVTCWREVVDVDQGMDPGNTQSDTSRNSPNPHDVLSHIADLKHNNPGLYMETMRQLERRKNLESFLPQVEESERKAQAPFLHNVRAGTRYKDRLPVMHAVGQYSLPENIYNEISTCFRAQLRLLPPKINIKEVFRPDTLLVCPRRGGLKFLDAVVQNVATVLEADVVRLDMEDIAQIIGGFLGEDIAWTRCPTAILGYGSRGRLEESKPLGKKRSLNDEEEDGTSEIDDAQPIFISNDFGTIDGRNPLTDIIAIMQSQPKLFLRPNFSKGMSLVNFVGRSPSATSVIAEQKGSSESWNEHKLGRAVEAIVAAADAKRARSVVDTANQLPDKGNVVLPESKGLIIQICDYKDLNEHPLGYNVLRAIREVVKKRWYEGKSIMIVGTTAEEWPDQAAEQVKNCVDKTLSPEAGFEIPKMIFVPPEHREKVISVDRKAQIRELNLRHVEHMIRKLLGADNESHWVIDLNKGLHSNKEDGFDIDSTVWRYAFVRRIAMAMLGSETSNGLLDGAALRQAFAMLDLSDAAKFRWAKGDDKSRAVVKDIETVILDGDSGSTTKTAAVEDKLDKLKKQCTSHEKRLLGGVIDPADIRTTFADIQAPPETIEALKTLTSLSLIRPDSFSYGVLATDKISGLLLYGPPGTGKTLLAKAVAKESGATMLEVSASEINDMYVGESEKNVKALFALAKKLSPCVVFIDEADSLFGARGDNVRRRNHRELINQFLREWDGMNDLSAFIMVATNRPFDLDEAVLRRLPRRLLVDLPVEKDREAILKIHLRDEILDDSVSLATLAKNTPFYSGSDLKNLSVAAALACVREENEIAAKYSGEQPYEYPSKRILRKEHFDRAMEEISASISEDMSTLSAIRKFDERYGDRKGRRKRASALGFGGTTDPEPDSEAARVRKIPLDA